MLDQMIAVSLRLGHVCALVSGEYRDGLRREDSAAGHVRGMGDLESIQFIYHQRQGVSMGVRLSVVLERRFTIGESERDEDRRAVVNANNANEGHLARGKGRHNVHSTLDIDGQRQECVCGVFLDVQAVHDDLTFRFNVDTLLFDFRSLHTDCSWEVDGIQLTGLDLHLFSHVRFASFDDGARVVVGRDEESRSAVQLLLELLHEANNEFCSSVVRNLCRRSDGVNFHIDPCHFRLNPDSKSDHKPDPSP